MLTGSCWNVILQKLWMYVGNESLNISTLYHTASVMNRYMLVILFLEPCFVSNTILLELIKLKFKYLCKQATFEN